MTAHRVQTFIQPHTLYLCKQTLGKTDGVKLGSALALMIEPIGCSSFHQDDMTRSTNDRTSEMTRAIYLYHGSPVKFALDAPTLVENDNHSSLLSRGSHWRIFLKNSFTDSGNSSASTSGKGLTAVTHRTALNHLVTRMSFTRSTRQNSQHGEKKENDREMFEEPINESDPVT
jgi:hypothetical protein